MKSTIPLLMLALLTAACTTKPIDVSHKAQVLIVPSVQKYTPEQYLAAANEHDKYCLRDKYGIIASPMLCKMIDDFSKMRDKARIAKINR